LEKIRVKRYSNGRATCQDDSVVSEIRASIRIGNREIAGLMALPEALDKLAIGYLYSEGFINGPGDIQSVHTDLQSGVVSVTLSNLSGRNNDSVAACHTLGSSKGIIQVLDHKNLRILPTGRCPAHHISSLLNAVNILSRTSELFQVTGGVHSSGFWMDDGFSWVYDDIGRHNAVDKVIGRAIQCLWPIPDTAVLVSTGRISSDIVIKAVRAGFHILVSRSAPMGMAVRIAQTHGLTLVGFARRDSCNIYTHIERIDTA
jgi:FdhD protein